LFVNLFIFNKKAIFILRFLKNRFVSDFESFSFFFINLTVKLKYFSPDPILIDNTSNCNLPKEKKTPQ